MESPEKSRKPRNTPVKRKAKHQSEESEDEQSEMESPEKSRLSSDEDEQVVDKKGKGKGKGKGKSSSIVKRKSESQAEVPVIQENRGLRNRDSAGKSKPQKAESPDQSDHTSDEDMSDKTSSSESEAHETVRPKRSAKAKVLHDSSDESVDQDHQYSKPTPTKKSSTIHKEKKSSQGGRPLRQATQRALQNFQTGSDTEEGESSSRAGPSHFSRPQNTRDRPSRRMNHYSDSMEDVSASRSSMPRTSSRRANVSNGMNIHEEERRSVRERNYSRSEVTISAADSSTDHIRTSRPDHSRPQRHRVRPARLMDDEEEEEEEERVSPQRRNANQEGRLARSSRNSARRRELAESEDESLAARAKRRSSNSRKRKNNVTQQQQHSYKRIKREIDYRDAESNDEEEDSEDEVPINRRRTRKSPEVPKNSTPRQQHNTYNRNRKKINYRDVESNNEEDSEDEIPISRRRRPGKSNRGYVEKESSSEESQGKFSSMDFATFFLSFLLKYACILPVSVFQPNASISKLSSFS